MFIELSFVQIWSFCWRKTAIAEVLKTSIRRKIFFLYCTNAGTISPGPSQCPADRAGLSQPTGTSSSNRGSAGALLIPGITGTDYTGSGILRPPRLLYNGAKSHQPPPIPRGIPSNPTHPHPNQCKSRFHHGTIH